MALFLERFNLMCFTFLKEAIKSFLPVENHFINSFYKNAFLCFIKTSL